MTHDNIYIWAVPNRNWTLFRRVFPAHHWVCCIIVLSFC